MLPLSNTSIYGGAVSSGANGTLFNDFSRLSTFNRALDKPKAGDRLWDRPFVSGQGKPANFKGLA
jgi:hypothetical protein